MTACARPGCGHAVRAHVPGGGCVGNPPPSSLIYASPFCGCEEFMPEPETPSLAAQVAGGVATFGEAFEPVLEAVNGYRGKLLDLDYPAPIAARMAADYHAALLQTLTSSSSNDEERGST